MQTMCIGGWICKTAHSISLIDVISRLFIDASQSHSSNLSPPQLISETAFSIIKWVHG